MNLACRACRVPLSAIAGCALCDPVRQNLVVVGEAEEDRPSLSSVGAEVVRELRSEVGHIRALRKEDPDDPKTAARLLSAANTVAKVIGEVRKLQDDGKAAIENMAFAERAELFIDWYAQLPPAYRAGVRDKMADFEAHVSAPITPEKVLS